MRQATIRDVAKAAGVSVASVSRALNGLGNVRPEMRERVVAAAAELRYVPHEGARSLSLARSRTIGVVLPDLHGEFFSEILRGIDRETYARGYHLLLSNMHADTEGARAALAAMRGRVDGLIVMAPSFSAEALDAMLPAGLPVLLVNAAPNRHHPMLVLDNRAGAEAMTRHLVESGRRSIVHIRGPHDNLDADEREQGFRAALSTLLPGAGARVLPGVFDEASGEAAVRVLLAEEARFDAIFAANDMMALGALHALRQAGKQVPEEAAVAGFDDVPLARYLELTTVRVDMAAIGGRGATRLIAALESGGLSAEVERITPQVVVRRTAP